RRTYALSLHDALPICDERRRMLVEWNDTARPLPERTVVELFRDRARMRPDAEALSCRGTVLTYAELSARVRTVPRHESASASGRSEEHTSELQSPYDL